eukprot:GFUD01086258.1.p1 GENE.GFUD01086258.1~~GFUD01086258.1.p1  ORF type:complete len:171 (+),score=31.39 GFUD01086258.1:48-560(+)
MRIYQAILVLVCYQTCNGLDNKEVIENFLHAVSTLDVKTVVELMADDFSFTVNEGTDSQKNMGPTDYAQFLTDFINDESWNYEFHKTFQWMDGTTAIESGDWVWGVWSGYTGNYMLAAEANKILWVFASEGWVISTVDEELLDEFREALTTLDVNAGKAAILTDVFFEII